MASETKLAVLLHADVVGSTALVHEDERLAHNEIREAFNRLSAFVSNYGGAVRELRGDAIVAEFSKGSDALSAAVAFQEAAERSQASNQLSISLRIGIAMGEVVVADGTVTGAGVVLAQRIEQLSEPRGVCIQGAVYETLPRRLPFDYDHLGAHELKGFPQPVSVVSARLRPGEVLPAPARSGTPERMEAPQRPAIAVLPFENQSGDPEQDFFADGMAEDLITDLSKISGLFIVARDSSFAYRGRLGDSRRVARELGVQYLLQGSVRKAGGRVRISAQLVDTTSSSPVWADRYDGLIDEAFELQDRVSAQVVSALSVRLTPGEQERLQHVHTRNVDAYELFVRARTTPFPPVKARIDSARRMFEQVIELDEGFAGGYAGVAWILAFEGMIGSVEVEFDFDRAFTMAQKAIEVDPAFGWSYSALALTLLNRRHYDEAIAAARDSIAHQPSDADAHWQLGLILGLAGRTDEGIDEIDTAIRLNPLYVGGPYQNSKRIVYGVAGDFANVVACHEQNVRQDGPVGPTALAEAAAGYHALGRTEAATLTLTRLRADFPGWSLRTGWPRGRLIRDPAARDRLHGLMLQVGVPE